MVAEWIKEISNWEKEYLTMDIKLTDRQKEILNGAEIKSHEGMLFGGMPYEFLGGPAQSSLMQNTIISYLLPP